MSELKTLIANRLKTAREEQNLTQSDVAEALGIERGSYSQIEIGRNMLTIEHLLKLPAIFHRPIHYFLGQPGPNEITFDEVEVLELFRSISPGLPRETALDLLRSLAQRSKNWNNNERPS